MITQIGFQKLLKYIFKNENKKYLVINNILNINLHITQKGYNLIKLYLIKNKFSINDFDLLLGILATLAYGHPSENFKYYIRKMMTRNKKLIIKNIDKLNIKVIGSFNSEECLNLRNILDKNISFELLQTISSPWIGEYRLHKTYFYNINYLLIYFSRYCNKDFKKWFLKTNSINLKVIFASQILSNYNMYQHKQIYTNSKIDFLRVASKISLFNNEDKIDNLNLTKENLYFIMLYIKRNYYKLDDENIEKFNIDITKFKAYFQYLIPELLDEFLDINLNILYEIVKLVENIASRDKMIIKVLKLLDNKLQLNDNQYILKTKIEDVNLYGKIILEQKNINQINEIENKFDKIYNKMVEPYYFYKFKKRYLDNIEQLLYFLIIICIYYLDKDSNKIDKFRLKLIKVLYEFEFYSKNDIDLIIQQIKEYCKMLENRKCLVCQSENKEIVFTQTFNNILGISLDKFEQNIAIYKDCGMVYTTPFVNDEELNNYYSHMSNYEHSHTDVGYPIEDQNKSERQFEYINKFIDKQKSILDVGCAVGYTLSLFKNDGYEVLGLEPSAKNKQIAKEKYDVEVETRFLDKNGLDGKEFDVVMLSHVAEHLKYPKDIFLNIRKVLSNDGLLFIETPDIDKFDEQDLYQFSFEHINYFNLSSTKNLLQSCGFELVDSVTFNNDANTAPFYPTLGTIWKKSDKSFELNNAYKENKQTIQTYIDLVNSFRGGDCD